LTLTDPSAPSFAPSGCRTIHDVIRFCTKKRSPPCSAYREILPDDAASVRLVTHLPVGIRCVDLGGGLRAGLTTCDRVTPDDVTSLPFKALWRGSPSRGLVEGTINFEQNRFMKMLAATATSEFGDAPAAKAMRSWGMIIST
jgi:pyruvate,water dikinase